MDKLATNTVKRCKFCGTPLDADGYCTKPCKMGALYKKIGKKQGN